MKKEKKKEIFTYIIILVVVILIKSYVVTPIRVNGTSMSSTLENGEIMILNETKYYFNDVKRFDIVVVKQGKSKLIKRVIGLPGDTLKFENNILYINGEIVEEPYLREETLDFSLAKFNYDNDVIPDKCYFVMGDNRDDSLDSRYFGCIEKKDILGSAKLVVYPFNKIGTVN